MSAASLRIAGASDVPALFDIRLGVTENAMTRDELAQAGVTPQSVEAALEANARAWLAEIGGEAAAFAMADNDEGCVFAMFVKPGFEGRGFGRMLMGEAERYLSRDHATLWLNTGADARIRAHGFYRRLGWRMAGPAGKGELRYEKTVTMEKDR